MSIYEAIGGSFVILMACIGIYTVGLFTYQGLKRVGGEIEIGRLHEDSAVREYLERLARQ